MQRGHGFVDSGTGGCVFRPHIKCNDVNVSKDTVGKIFVDHHYNSELKRFLQIKKIDTRDEFTVPFYGTCEVTKKNFKPTDEMEKCQKDGMESQMNQIVYGNGGRNLYDFVHHEDFALDDLVQNFRSLFVGIDRISKGGLCHFDIKPQNIMIDKNNKLYIVDFGLTDKLDNVFHEKNTHKLFFDYQWYSPELKLWCILRQNMLDKYEDVLKFLNKNFKIIPMQDVFLHFPHQEQFLNSFYIFCKYERKKAMKTIEDNSHKVDTYSLGMTLYYVLRVCAETGKYRSVPLMKRLFSLVSKMICLDVRVRLTPHQALAEFDKILQKSSSA